MTPPDTAVPTRGRLRFEKWILAALTVVGLVIAVGQLPGDTILVEIESDIPWTIATHLHEGQGYTACTTKYFPFCGPGNDQTAMREPVPVLAFLGAMRLSPSPFAGVLLDIGLYLGVMYLLYFSLRADGGGFALTAAFLWLVSVPVAQEIGSGSGQLIAASLLTGGLITFHKGRSVAGLGPWIVAGICLGLAALSRSVFLYASIGLGLGLLVDVTAGKLRARIGKACTLLLTVAVVVTPWAARNQLVFGSPIVGSTLSGYNLFRHNHIVAQADFRPHYVGSKEARQAVAAAVLASDLVGNEDERQMQSFYARTAQQIIRAHPLEYLRLVGFRFFVLWFNLTMKAGYGQDLDRWDYIMAGQHLLVLLAVCAGVARHRTRFWPQALGTMLATAAYMAVGAQARYLVELMPMIVVLAASPLLPAGSQRAGGISRQLVPQDR